MRKNSLPVFTWRRKYKRVARSILMWPYQFVFALVVARWMTGKTIIMKSLPDGKAVITCDTITSCKICVDL